MRDVAAMRAEMTADNAYSQLDRGERSLGPLPRWYVVAQLLLPVALFGPWDAFGPELSAGWWCVALLPWLHGCLLHIVYQRLGVAGEVVWRTPAFGRWLVVIAIWVVLVGLAHGVLRSVGSPLIWVPIGVLSGAVLVGMDMVEHRLTRRARMRKLHC